MIPKSKTNAELGLEVLHVLADAGMATPMDPGLPEGYMTAACDDQKIEGITHHMTEVMKILGLDLSDDSLVDTPRRIAKMYVQEIFGGLKTDTFPKATTVDNKMGYGDLIIEKCTVKSVCVVGSTLIDTPRGRIPISKLKDGDWIYTMDPDTFELQLARCENPHVTRQNAELVEVYTDNDSVFCTPEHRFLLTDGEWKAAQDLRADDRIASLYRSTDGTGHVFLNSGGSKWHPTRTNHRGNALQITEHQFVWECFNEGVYSGHEDGQRMALHHIDEVPFNNDPVNIAKLTVSEHNRIHQRTQKLADNENRLSAVAESSARTDVRNKRSASVKAYWDALKNDVDAYDDIRRKMSEGRVSEVDPVNHRVIGVRKVEWAEDVWNMEVPGTHLYFANGMAVHNCEHHFVYFGTAHNTQELGCWIAYIPKEKVLGLSKLNRITNYFSRRPQIQERLTGQIAHALKHILGTEDVAVVMRAQHFCVLTRGVEDADSNTTTSSLHGRFMNEPELRAELMTLVNRK